MKQPPSDYRTSAVLDSLLTLGCILGLRHRPLCRRQVVSDVERAVGDWHRFTDELDVFIYVAQAQVPSRRHTEIVLTCNCHGWQLETLPPGPLLVAPHDGDARLLLLAPPGAQFALATFAQRVAEFSASVSRMRAVPPAGLGGGKPRTRGHLDRGTR